MVAGIQNVEYIKVKRMIRRSKWKDEKLGPKKKREEKTCRFTLREEQANEK